MKDLREHFGEEPPLEPASAARPWAVALHRGEAPDIILDISRLIARMNFRSPTGVDRVEMAYARGLLERAPERVSFAAVHPCGRYGRLSTKAAIAFLNDTIEAWDGNVPASGHWVKVIKQVVMLWRLFPKGAGGPIDVRFRSRAYVQVSPHHLDRPESVRKILRRERARFVCLIHDLIPIEFPEYARPQDLDKHNRRMRTIATLADGVIAASEAVRRSYLNHLHKEGRTATVKVAPLGVQPKPDSAPAASPLAEPYFVAVGTIEPRKNHLLLLNLWRQLVDERGPAATPKLLLIGRRGWENENILDMLDRCPGLKGVIEERGHLSDQDMWPLVQGARAVLMPSFAEGFGLPVVEALSMGIPVLCSDIPTHREVSGDVAEYLDPLDGPGWKSAILDYAQPASRRRYDQLGRLAHWRAPKWADHIDTALDLIAEVSQ